MKTDEPVIQEQFENWVYACGLFSPGDHVKAELAITWAKLDQNPPRYRNSYDYRRVALTEKDWKIILSVLPPEQAGGMRFIRRNGNRPTDIKEIRRKWKKFSHETTNNYLRKAGVEFRIVKPGGSRWAHYKVLSAKIRSRKRVRVIQPLKLATEVTV